MTNWSYNAAKNIGTLTLLGEVTIHHVSDLKNALVEAFDCAEQVVIDVSKATAFDVAGMQLIYACKRFSASHGKQMCLTFGDNNRFADFLKASGFPLNFICNHDEKNKCEWTSGT